MESQESSQRLSWQFCLVRQALLRDLWNGRDQSGRLVSPGVYFYRFETGNQQISRKLVVLRP